MVYFWTPITSYNLIFLSKMFLRLLFYYYFYFKSSKRNYSSSKRDRNWRLLSFWRVEYFFFKFHGLGKTQPFIEFGWLSKGELQSYPNRKKTCRNNFLVQNFIRVSAVIHIWAPFKPALRNCMNEIPLRN